MRKNGVVMDAVEEKKRMPLSRSIPEALCSLRRFTVPGGCESTL
jgi:hypothetical protein